jgi:hypothetical protein
MLLPSCAFRFASINSAGRGRPQSIRKHPGIGGGPPRSADARWNALGDMPTISEKRELNDPKLENPTSMQTSVTDRLAERRRSLARSTRRRLR